VALREIEKTEVAVKARVGKNPEVHEKVLLAKTIAA
jgi:hypothetical protein